MLASLEPMYGRIAGPPLRGKQRLSRTFPPGRAATFGLVSSVRSNTGLLLPIRLSGGEFLAIMCGRPGCGLRSNP